MWTKRETHSLNLNNAPHTTTSMKIYQIWGVIVALLAILALVLGAVLDDYYAAFKAVFGIVYILFIPGYFLTLAFFKEVDLLERITLSVALSIATVPLVVITGNRYLHLIVNTFNIILEVLLIIAIALVFLYFQSRKSGVRTAKKVVKKTSRTKKRKPR